MAEKEWTALCRAKDAQASSAGTSLTRAFCLCTQPLSLEKILTRYTVHMTTPHTHQGQFSPLHRAKSMLEHDQRECSQTTVKGEEMEVSNRETEYRKGKPGKWKVDGGHGTEILPGMLQEQNADWGSTGQVRAGFLQVWKRVQRGTLEGDGRC